MEIFKSDILKKEFKDLVENILPSLNECANCRIFCYQYCSKFSINCAFCRKARCKNCMVYEQSKELLLNTGGEISKGYVANFLVDYLNMTKTSAKFF